MIPYAEPQKSSIKADMNRVILDRSSSSQGSVCWSKMMWHMTTSSYMMSSAGYKVIFESDRIFDHITFWSNHRVACIEPFISYCLESGEEFEWIYKFRIM